MKKYAAILVLGLAVLFGVAAVALTNRWLESQVSAETPVIQSTIPITLIAIAAKDVDIGMRLLEANLSLVQWPKANVPRGAFTDLKELEGRVAVTPINAGMPVIAASLASPGSGAGLLAKIKPNKRAMSIRVNEETGVGGFILPNTFVDVVAVIERKDRKKFAETILKNIEVLAVAQETFIEEGKPQLVKTVTLELLPEEAEALALQTNSGEIHLVLRNPLVEETLPPVKEPPPKKRIPTLKSRVVVPPSTPYSVEILRGQKDPEKISFKNVESEERL